MSKSKLYDNHGRLINYLRLAVTDRCNLRCHYCMPAKGINYVPRKDLLSYEEMLRIVTLLTQMGIVKLRITGGEPFLRKDMMQFLRSISQLDTLEQIHITTNGTLTKDIVPELKELGIKSVNLSLDSLDKEKFFQITRRDELEKVMETLHLLLNHKIKTKINTVVMNGVNTDEIISMAELTKDFPISVRFIEEMPFNGKGKNADTAIWTYQDIYKKIEKHFPNIQKIKDPLFSTSLNYQIPNHLGTVGIIPAYSRTFCGTCNRIRITPKGLLKTCLYDDGVFNVKDLIRAGATDQQLKTTFLEALGNRTKDGFEAEQNRNSGRTISESMSSIGG